MQRRLDTARAAAQAGARTISDRGRDMGRVRSKSTAIDVVTDTDIAAGVSVVESILSSEPHASFVIEEEEVYGLTDCRRGDLGSGEVWVVDPLDGTTSFVHGYPTFSVAVALLQDGVPVAGAVHNVPAGETVSAGQGLGATLDRIPVHCTQVAHLNEALLITGFPYDRGELLDRQLGTIARFLRAPVHGLRRDGSAAVDCCHVATGRADGFWEHGLKPWDMAAGVIILRESGAHVTGIAGEDWTPESTGIIAANSALHARMAEIVLGTLAD